MFLILALPRSRTFWLSKFLSYGDFECGHEEARHLRTIEDARIWLNQEKRGTVETSVAPFWRLFRDFNPSLRVVTIRRPVAEVVAGLMGLNMMGVCEYNEVALTHRMMRLDAKLDQIEKRLGALSVKFSDLDDEQTIKRIFETCLPYPFDSAWWEYAKAHDLQCNMRAMMRYAAAYQEPLDKLAKQAAQLCRAKMMAQPPKPLNGLTFQQESFDAWERDGVDLFEAHCTQVGEAPDQWKRKNIPLMREIYAAGRMQITTARCNGRMFGYVNAIIYPSLEFRTRISAVHTTHYASPEFPGLGLKLQRASIAALRARGVEEVFFHEGIRGDGPRTGVIYKRLGAQEFGKFHRLQFGES